MCSVKKGVFGNFAKFTGKHLCQNLFSDLIDDHELFTLKSEPTCFKSINPTCIDNF